MHNEVLAEVLTKIKERVIPIYCDLTILWPCEESQFNYPLLL